MTNLPPDSRESDDLNRELHVYVSGLVQGVFFRQTTQHMARSLQVTGWVRNLPDGRVEVIAQGSPVALDRLLLWLHHGPDTAVVESLEVCYQTRQKSYSSFSITSADFAFL